ncbi:hypothetical protein QFZ37_003227 [Chryseobacterium ginsenosidimutans]|uniref:hypothetical protein n=1 Tax=Chryseobacterium ginsenosidimutans TaxID=687846 RepID=UPI0027871303|nr:hypothetical protein [Chryseobacterium ginsenosidimutans]MDQ0594858.1 hypothetical protein [Chryseobacterium ginsenosidimutans]
MELNAFQELSEKITLECFYMSDSQQEEKIIQLIDLHHFVECYHQSLKVIDYVNNPVNIIEENGIKKGILFYDLKFSSPLNPYESDQFKKENALEELWFVFVEEDAKTLHSQYADFIIENAVEVFYDKIFVFNFFQSIISSLK